MALQAAPTLPKTAPKKNLKRIMLAKQDVEITTLGGSETQSIVSSLSNYVRQFESRSALSKHILLGFNSISRKLELCDDNLVIVILNGSVKAKMMISTLFKLCVQKGVPVACLENFKGLCQELRHLFKGLKQNFVALGILSACPKDFQASIIEKLPSVAVQGGATQTNRSDHSTPVDPGLAPETKRPRPCTPTTAQVNVSKFYISHNEAALFLQTNGMAQPSSDTLEFAEGMIPFVDYDSFIGSDRPLIKEPPVIESNDGHNEESSTYREPVIKFR